MVVITAGLPRQPGMSRDDPTAVGTAEYADAIIQKLEA